MEKLVVIEGRQGEDRTVREEYVHKVMERADETWCDEDGVEEKWETVCSTLVTTAEEVLGPAGHSQTDCFRDSMDNLKPLLTIRNTVYSRWLGTSKQEDLNRFKKARGVARRVVRRSQKRLRGKGLGERRYTCMYGGPSGTCSKEEEG